MHQEISLQEAVRNLTDIRRAIERVEDGKKRSMSLRTVRTTVLLQAGAALAAGVFLGADLYDGSMTFGLLYSADDAMWRAEGIVSMGAILMVLTVAIYYVLWKGARGSGEPLNDYVARNFVAMSTLSFVSDLFVKFVGAALIILAQAPEFVPPFLFICTADYLFQGRLFTLPFALSVGAGVACIIAAAAQVLHHSGSVIPPLAVFTSLAILSAVRTALRARSAISSEA